MDDKVNRPVVVTSGPQIQIQRTPVPDTSEPQIQIQRTPISDDVLERVYVLGQGMCPTPFAYAQLKNWVEKCPEFCIEFQATLEGAAPTPMGVVIMLPIVKTHWMDVIVGKIRENDVDATTMFARDPGAEVGLHIFYIERFDTVSRQRNFGVLALNTARVIAEKKGWNLAGFSGMSSDSPPRCHVATASLNILPC
ncbi:hypothetical protein IMZ48_27565 [Candidatus Bathyarchaeota archaeon]|nr:hypothetical protein [Candidatus Bathyarchaeota archaeon]